MYSKVFFSFNKGSTPKADAYLSPIIGKAKTGGKNERVF